MKNNMKKDLKRDAKNFLKFFLSELKPKGKLLTPFNFIAATIIFLGAVIAFFRFKDGLGSVTNLSQEYPWGLWIGFDVITGVAFAGGAYVITFMVYILRMKKYDSIVRITVLNGLLSYMFYAGALLLDLGKPWNVINPIIGNSFGMNSVMFLVAWHFALYMIAEFLEFSPAIAEWFGSKKLKKWLHGITFATVIIGITLSTLHQAGLGALFLMTKSKLHPLWYTEFIPILFFVSSIFAGLSMVIVEGSISKRVFSNLMSPEHHHTHNDIVFGLGKICAIVMYVYFFLKIVVLFHSHSMHYLDTPLGLWYISEMLFFTLLPLAMFTYSVRHRKGNMIRAAAILTLIGIVINRLNVTIIAFNWNLPERYYPSWQEIELTLAVIFLEIVVLRWIVVRMPVFNEKKESREDKISITSAS